MKIIDKITRLLRAAWLVLKIIKDLSDLDWPLLPNHGDVDQLVGILPYNYIAL